MNDERSMMNFLDFHHSSFIICYLLFLKCQDIADSTKCQDIVDSNHTVIAADSDAHR